MIDSTKKKFSRWFSGTNTIPLMIGLCVGLFAFNPDIVTNVFLTILGGGTWHAVRLFTIGQ